MKPKKRRLNRLGHTGYIFIFLGQFMLAEKLKWGWISRIIGEALWLIVGVKMRMSSIWFWGLIGIFFEIYGLIRWMGWF